MAEKTGLRDGCGLVAMAAIATIISPVRRATPISFTARLTS